MIVDPNNPRHLIAKEGKVIARLKNMKETYKEVWLGYHTDKNGVKKMDTKSDFTEISVEKIKKEK
jgi:hypothetical protein